MSRRLTSHRSKSGWKSGRQRLPVQPSLYFVLLVFLMAALWIGGGASRADALGQVVVRATVAVLLTIAAAFGARPAFGAMRPVLILLVLSMLLAMLQIVPLPPVLWQALPGREPFLQAAAISGQAQPWRPIAIVPGAAVNALLSLTIPLTVLILVAGLGEHERRFLPGLLLATIVTSMLAGLVQASGVRFDNPLTNETVGYVAGSFANRNHFALFLALGCALAPVWALEGQGRSRARWRGFAAVGLILLFALVILASGSRAGLVLGALGIGLGAWMVKDGLRRGLRRQPRWVLPVLVVVGLGILAALIVISVGADRAASINRALTIDPQRDMRGRALPTVLGMISAYFPFGSGLGGFDPLFRMHEPFALLKPTFFNHAHNDWLEIVLDAGLPGAMLLAVAVLWWARASIRAWRGGAGAILARLGSTMILLIMLASLSDYPARTPMVMATIVIAAIWLHQGDAVEPPGRALP